MARKKNLPNLSEAGMAGDQGGLPMTADDLTEDELTMLAKCEVAKNFGEGDRSLKKVETLAYPTIGRTKRFFLLNRLTGLGLIEHTNGGWRTTAAGTKLLKDFAS